MTMKHWLIVCALLVLVAVSCCIFCNSYSDAALKQAQQEIARQWAQRVSDIEQDNAAQKKLNEQLLRTLDAANRKTSDALAEASQARADIRKVREGQGAQHTAVDAMPVDQLLNSARAGADSYNARHPAR